MTWSATDSPTLDFEFISGQMKGHVIGSAGEPIAASSLSGLEQYFGGAVKVLPPPNGTNDTVGDKAISDALSAAGGGIVFIPPGTRLWGNFRPANNVTYAGTGTASVLKRVGNAHVVEGAYDAALLSNVVWRDLKIDGDKFLGQSTGHGIKMENSNNLLLENLQLVNCWEASIGAGCNKMLNAGGKITIRRCWSHNPAHDAAIDAQTWGGFYVSGGDDNVVEGCWATATDGLQGYGIDIEPFQTITCARVNVINNFVYNGTIKIAPTSTATVEDAKIRGNQIVHIESQGSGAGIQLDGHIVGLMEILDNSIWTDETNSKMACIGQLGEGNGAVKLVVHRNILTGLGATENTSGLGNLAGLYLEGSTEFTDISDNQFWGIGYDSTDGSKTIEVGSWTGRIANNYFQANAPTHPTYVAGITAPNTFKMYGNIFHSNITVPFPVGGPYQMDWPVPTANLPAANAALNGLRLIEVVDATNRKIVNYDGGKRFKSVSHAES